MPHVCVPACKGVPRTDRAFRSGCSVRASVFIGVRRCSTVCAGAVEQWLCCGCVGVRSTQLVLGHHLRVCSWGSTCGVRIFGGMCWRITKGVGELSTVLRQCGQYCVNIMHPIIWSGIHHTVGTF
jgi:hypothetical protein